ncbi:strawberry notch family protein, partial [Arthrospira platensis SPKY1]|nr:strawberry notch family protein [Arthrospira platensis SPKY1]
MSEQLGMGRASLMKRFSPEQIDGVAIMLSRLLVGRSSILADDTGIGKGRQLAALAVWANKSGKDVVFVTDRANLFSDLARDLNDIGEWGRFAPLVFNADGEITVDAGPDQPPRVLAKGESPAVLNRLIEDDVSLREAGRNICFLTYSQINTEESEKARWLKNQVKDALVIFDEAHICAGSDSNMAAHASEIASA